MAEGKVTRVTVTPDAVERIRRGVDWERLRSMTEEEIERGIAADPDAAPPMTDAEIAAARVRWVRQQTGLSQPDFAARYAIPVGTLRDWEQGRREPDAAALAYLKAIAREPEMVARALATA